MGSVRYALLLSLFATLDAQLFYDDVKHYGCRCLQKDQTGQLLNSLTKSMNGDRPIWQLAKDSASLTSNIQSKIHFLKHWLSTLTLDTPTVPPTTTTPRPATVDPLALPYDEGTGNSVFVRLAYKIMAKYLKKFRGEWSILDRFECVCDGNLIELLNSKTFINIQIAHD
ncbi:unnamed protein product [Caenorhabditis sp. 36 PRJEB53466]|nr:unnamed protein product [Caenorhabditis sp. 36 PRJEB53466]